MHVPPLPAVTSHQLLVALPLVISGIALFVSLSQMRLLRRQLHLDALIKIVDSNRQLLELGFEKPALWEFFVTDVARVTDKSAQEERRRYFQLWMNHIHLIWKAHKLGLYDRSEWRCTRADMLDFFKLDHFTRHWEEVTQYYPAAFCREMKRLAKEAATPK